MVLGVLLLFSQPVAKVPQSLYIGALLTLLWASTYALAALYSAGRQQN